VTAGCSIDSVSCMREDFGMPMLDAFVSQSKKDLIEIMPDVFNGIDEYKLPDEQRYDPNGCQ
jgi:hypothetical protein